MIVNGYKYCPGYNQNLPADQFFRDRCKKDGLASYCKKCKREKNYIWIKTTEKGVLCEKRGREKYRKTEKARTVANKCAKKRRENGKIYAYKKKLYRTDPEYVLEIFARSQVSRFLKYRKEYHSNELLGCSYKEAREHIEAQFEPGMTWENRGKSCDEWSIDHIIPIAYAKKNNIDLKIICNFQNLQPLWNKDNFSKHAKVPENVEELVEFLKQEIYEIMDRNG